LKSREDCEGLVQNIFSDIWENRERLDSTRSFYGYLFRIAKNKVYNHLRRNVNKQVYKEYIINSNMNSEYKTEADLDFSELNAIIEQSIAKLPPRRKEIFMLSRSEGLTYREIGRRLNISENTVDTQIRNALDFIREELKKRGTAPIF
jgi:RNA polymerase sigma-70 factor (ECF subfamily)